MKVAILPSALARSTGRLDPKHLFATHKQGPTVLTGAGASRRIGDIGEPTQPSRFKRVYATSHEERVPYLRPYDIFDYLPGPADFLSKERSDNLEGLAVEPGTILQTCSGRNLARRCSLTNTSLASRSATTSSASRSRTRLTG